MRHCELAIVQVVVVKEVQSMVSLCRSSYWALVGEGEAWKHRVDRSSESCEATGKPCLKMSRLKIM